MKNMYKLISVLLVSIMLFCSCSTEVVIPKTELQTSAPTPTPTAEETPMPTKVEDIGRIVYASFQRTIGKKMQVGHDYDKNNLPTIQETLEPYECVVDESVPKNITWNYFGHDFELKYVCSGYDGIEKGFADEYVDLYSTNPGITFPALQVTFLHGTKQPVQIRYNHDWFDYADLINVDIPKTEEEFLNIIKLHNEMLSKDFSEYSYKVEIRYDDDRRNLVTHTNISDIKNTGRDINFLEIHYYPKQVSGYDVKSHPILSVSSYAFDMYYGETDFEECTKPIEISDFEVEYAYYEVLDFAQKNCDYININLGEDQVDFKLVPKTFDPSETTVEVLNGRLYLCIKLHLLIDENEFVDEFFVDYQRLQWKMALEGKT